MVTVHLILVILALMCFLLAAFVDFVRRVNLIAAGLFLWVLSTLVAR